MRRSWFPCGAAALATALLGAACATPPPRFPFDISEGWHGMVTSTKRYTDDRFHPEYTINGVQLITEAPGGNGWGWEVAVRYGGDTNTELRRIRIVPQGAPATTADVPTERNSDFYELDIGTRQTFRGGTRLQPYVGVGTSIMQIHNVDVVDTSGLPPLNPNVEPPRTVEHYQQVGLGFYLRGGLRWNLLRDQFQDKTEAVMTLDVRAMYGEEYSTIEVTLGLGFGR